MKRLLAIIAAIFMSMVLAIPAAAPVLADSDETGNIKPAWPAALMIKALKIINVGQPLTITVFSKRGQETIAGVSVYALKAENLVTTADNTNYTTLMTLYEAAAENEGVFLGTTDNTGSVTGKLTETGRFILVAVKDGYTPGFARVSSTLAATKGLNIKAPGSIEVNKTVTFSVYERYTQQAVAGAAIYAKLIDTLSVPAVSSPVVSGKVPPVAGNKVVVSQNIAASIKVAEPPKVIASSLSLANSTVIAADPAGVSSSVQYAAEIKSTGILLGYTDNSGQLTYTFTESGVYVLASVLEGYAPGLAKISVRIASQDKLLVKSPGSADVGSSVIFTVVDRSSGQGIAGTDLWALRTDNIKGTAESVWDSLVAGSAVSDVMEKYRGWAKDKGIFLGTSTESGEVIYTFSESGCYLVVAIKDGYAPGFNRIKVGLAEQKQITIKAPLSAVTGQQITITAVNSKTGEPVESATVYAFTDRPFEPPTVKSAPASNTNGTATQVVVDSSVTATVSVEEVQGLQVQSAAQTVKIGSTDASGQVQYTFTSVGKYVLTAIKDGYLSGGARISILPEQSDKALAINAAINMTTGQPAAIKVWEKASGQAVSAAAVYVLKVNDIVVVKPMPTTSNSNTAQNEAGKAREQGVLAGYTDSDGQLSYAFPTSGQYLLAAFKDGYNPGFVYFTYTLPLIENSLNLKAPSEAYTGDAVSASVFDSNGKSVSGVAIYSVRMDLLQDMAGVLWGTSTLDVAAKNKYGAIVKARSAFLGYTDTDGMLTFKLFNQGLFMLLAVKDGYTPDFVKINIKTAVITVPTTNTGTSNSVPANTSNSSIGNLKSNR